MAEFIKWDRPRGTVHNLATALSLKDSGCNILILSDASLYVLQNYMALDVEFKSRWADETFDKGYKPITFQSENYLAWVDLVHQIQGEVIDMSCDIVEALEAINDTAQVTNTRLEDIRQEIENLVTQQSTAQSDVDDVEELLDAINIILGGASVLIGA
jgi:uncharacterized protein YgbK (DUF1537 family)